MDLEVLDLEPVREALLVHTHIFAAASFQYICSHGSRHLKVAQHIPAWFASLGRSRVCIFRYVAYVVVGV